MKENNPQDKKKDFGDLAKNNWRYLLLILVMVLLALLVMEFNQRANDLHLVEGEKNLVGLRLDEQKGTQAALETEIAYAGSDRAAEEFARKYGKMKKVGDIPVVVVPDSGATPTPTPTPAPPPVKDSNPSRWWDLFFGPER